MQRITLAPVAGATGNTKAVKRPETFAAALELALEKEVLAGGAKRGSQKGQAATKKARKA